MFKSIPDNFIEDADVYIIKSIFQSNISFEIGGRIMMNQVVIEQMTIDNIVATAGIDNANEMTTGKTVCIIIVDYTPDQINAFIKKAQQKLGKLINETNGKFN